MWGVGGRYYWGRRHTGTKPDGVVVVFAWMSSQEKHLKHYIDLYASSGWNSLVCHSQFLNSFFPEKAELLAVKILDELVEELKINPVPVVFASFSGGPKACMYKVLQQIIQGIFDKQRENMSFGAPYLILCSEDDHLAPCQTICNFAQRLQELGADVKLVKWTSSPHVGHYRQHPVDYKVAVSELLQKASALYSQRAMKQGGGEKMGLEGSHDEISELLGDIRKAAAASNDIFKRFSVEMAGHSVVPSSFEYHEGKAVGSVEDEPKTRLIQLPPPPRINANGVLGQVLFDVCVPQNVEEWDVGPSSSSFLRSTRRHGMHFNPIKCIRRSRL